MNRLSVRQSRLQYYIKFSRKTRKCDEMPRKWRVVPEDFYDFLILMMIFKSLCPQKPLLKSQDFGTCYAGRGLRSGTPRWGYPSHRYRGGPLPASHVWMANILVTGHANMALTKTDKWQMIPRQITMSLEKQKRACKTNNTKLRSCLRHREKALSFRPSWQRQFSVTY